MELQKEGFGAYRSAVPTPVLTRVCKRVGVHRAPLGFSLAAARQEPAHQRVVIESDSLI